MNQGKSDTNGSNHIIKQQLLILKNHYNEKLKTRQDKTRQDI